MEVVSCCDEVDAFDILEENQTCTVAFGLENVEHGEQVVGGSGQEPRATFPSQVRRAAKHARRSVHASSERTLIIP